MALSSSSTYIYAYVVFAVIYLASSIAFVFNAVRVSTSLSKVRDLSGSPEHAGAAPSDTIRGYVSHSQRLVDYTQLATLLPLLYVVGSMFLGSLILGGTGHTGINYGWIIFTAAATVASIAFAALGIRESARLGQLKDIGDAQGSSADALQRIGVRLGISAAMLLLVAVFMLLNLFSILSSIQGLLNLKFLI